MSDPKLDAGLAGHKGHPFEKMGLGSPPFAVTQYIPLKDRDATCAACGTTIKHVYRVRSSDGRDFMVGSECVEKVQRDGLAEGARTAKQAFFQNRHEALIARLADPNVRTRLVSRPHPTPYYAAQGQSLLDYVKYCLGSGNAGAEKIAEVADMVDTVCSA